MRKRIRHIASGLILTFIIALIPNEYVHFLYGHEDTHCHYHPELTLEKRHHHCQILRHQFSVFVDVIIPRVPDKPCFPENPVIPDNHFFFSNSHSHYSPRSPPLSC